jgi:hypothetical protein
MGLFFAFCLCRVSADSFFVRSDAALFAAKLYELINYFFEKSQTGNRTAQKYEIFQKNSDRS